MSDPIDQPLSDAARALLMEERAQPTPAVAPDDVWSRLQPQLVPSAMAVATTTGLGVKTLVTIAFIAGATVGGTAVGIGISMKEAPPAPEPVRVVVETTATPTPEPVVVAEPAPAPVKKTTSRPVRSAEKPVVAAPVEEAPVATDLRAERALLDVARTALSRARPELALTSIDDHARRFPTGQLTEERESLAVQALVSAGRFDDARARAAAFHREHPASILGPVVDAALQTIPVTEKTPAPKSTP